MAILLKSQELLRVSGFLGCDKTAFAQALGITPAYLSRLLHDKDKMTPQISNRAIELLHSYLKSHPHDPLTERIRNFAYDRKATASDKATDETPVTEGRFARVTDSKRQGVVYTPTPLAHYVASSMLKFYIPSCPPELSVLDPAVGGGELLIALSNLLLERYPGLKLNLTGYETDASVAVATQQRLRTLFPESKVTIHRSDFLSSRPPAPQERFDCIIANPPYVRTQILGKEQVQRLTGLFNLKGRMDLYYAFLMLTEAFLTDNGVAGFITSNKFMTIKAGMAVRRFMQEHYRLQQITDLGDTELFDAAVLPSVLIFSKGVTRPEDKVRFTSVYASPHGAKAQGEILGICDNLSHEGDYATPDGKIFCYRQGTLHLTEDGAPWTLTTAADEKLLSRIAEHTAMTFAALGKIRVGIKTTADAVFLGDSSKWSGDDARLELLRPLITHRNAGQIVQGDPVLWQVLYPHTVRNGKTVVCNLEDYPQSAAYLKRFYLRLSQRSYLSKAGRQWYEIWVPQKAEVWSHRKIVFRDISEHPQFWYDAGGAIVNGDCYFIDLHESVSEDLICLALAVANSTFIERYYDLQFNNRLYAGKRRFQSQYVENFPLPAPDTPEALEAITLVRSVLNANRTDAFERVKERLNVLVDTMFTR